MNAAARRRRAAWTAAALLLTAVLLPVARAGAQQADTSGVRIERADTASYPQVRVRVSVPSGAVTDGMPAFALTEDGVPRDAAVRPLAADALRVVLVVDTSGSMRGAAMEGAKAAAQTFTARLPADAQLALVAFATQPRPAAAFGVPRPVLEEAIAGLSPQGETALYDAVGAALDVLGPAAPNDRRVIVLLSDGGDTASAATLEAATARLAQAQVRLVAVELATSETQRPALEALVAASRGTLLSTPDPAALAVLYDGIAAELVHSYELAYTSAAHGAAELRVALRASSASPASTQLVLPARPPDPLPPPAPAAPPATVMRPGTLSGAWTLYAGAGGVAAALLMLGLVAGRRAPRSVLPGRRNTVPVTGLADWASRTAQHTLERHRWGGALEAKLERGGIALRPGEYAVLAACIAFTAGAAGHLVGGVPVAAAATAVALLAAIAVLDIAAGRRQSKFADQLGDTLTLLAGSLRAGHSLLQAVDGVAREGESPTSEEFRRLVVETRLGRPLPAALDALAARMGSADFTWVAEAIVIHREVGGDLAQVLDRVAATIRERNQIRRQAKALSAEGRLSALVLVALPFFVTAFVAATNPGYLALLTTHPVGLLMLGVGGVLLLTGIVWLRKIVKVEF